MREVTDPEIPISVVDMGLIGPAEIGPDHVRVDAMRAFDDDGRRGLGVSGRGGCSQKPEDAENQTRGQEEPSKIAANKMHCAWIPIPPIDV